MLDGRTSALLEKINGLCGEGGFKIAEEGDLLSCFPPSDGAGKADLKRMLADLEERRYIEVKYAEEGVYCLRPLPEGKLYFENLRREQREGARRRTSAFAVSVLGGMLGSFLGALLALAVFFLVRGA